MTRASFEGVIDSDVQLTCAGYDADKVSKVPLAFPYTSIINKNMRQSGVAHEILIPFHEW